MRIWLWESIALQYTPPPPPPPPQHDDSCQDGDSLKTFEYIGHLETR